VRELESALGGLPEKMIETENLFERQIRKVQRGDWVAALSRWRPTL